MCLQGILPDKLSHRISLKCNVISKVPRDFRAGWAIWWESNKTENKAQTRILEKPQHMPPFEAEETHTRNW